jgi:hypothetical protein
MDEPRQTYAEVSEESKTEPDGQNAGQTSVVKELQTRFLYPFIFRRGMLKDSAASLRAQTFRTRSGDKQSLWDSAAPHGLYSQPHVTNRVES